jgi:F-type H+-transporting ATPase subunit epsilon
MADTKLQLELVTPARRVLSQQVDEVRAPGAAGYFGILPGHTEFVSLMKPGELVAVSGGQSQVFAVGEGFVEVAKDKVLVLAETADRAEDIDLAGAKSEVESETKKLSGLTQDSAEYELQRARVERAAARALVAGRKA